MLWTAKAKRPPKRPSRLDIALDSSNLVLSTLADAARLTPVPYLQEAAGVALRIVTIIQSVKSNKDGFRRLASDACALVYIILCRDKQTVVGVAAVTPTYLDHARDLADTLHEIYNYTKTQASRNRILQMVQYKSDTGMILEYRERLKQSLDEFSLKSSISIQDTLAAIQQQLSHVASQTKDLHEGEVRRQGSLLIEEQQRASVCIVDDAAEQARVENKQAAKKRRAEKEEAEQEMADKSRAEREKHDTERIKASQARVDREDIAHQPAHVPATLPVYTSNPFRQKNPFLPGLQSTSPASSQTVSSLQISAGLYATSALQEAHPGRPSSQGSFMSGGNQVIYSGSVIRGNSGNTTSHVVSNSNNDSSSVRIYQRGGRRR